MEEYPYNYIYSSNDNLCLNSCEHPHSYLSIKENFWYINCFSQNENTKFSLPIVEGTITLTRCLSECNHPEFPDINIIIILYKYV